MLANLTTTTDIFCLGSWDRAVFVQELPCFLLVIIRERLSETLKPSQSLLTVFYVYNTISKYYLYIE